MSGTVKALIVLGCLVAAAVVVPVAVWKVPYAGQWREDRPAADLLLAPRGPSGGPWRLTYDGVSGGDTAWGLLEHRTRGWHLLGWEPGVPSGLSETVRKFRSPNWADRAFLDDSWKQRRQRYGNEITERRVGDVGAGVPPTRYFCEDVDRDRPGCETWWVHLRRGQYVVELSAALPSQDAEVPGWLDDIVRDADGALLAAS